MKKIKNQRTYVGAHGEAYKCFECKAFISKPYTDTSDTPLYKYLENHYVNEHGMTIEEWKLSKRSSSKKHAQVNSTP